MSAPEKNQQAPTAPPVPWLVPSTSHLVVATAVAGLIGLLPQEAPLVYYPLDQPGKEILHLELTCVSSSPGYAQIFYDLNRGFNEFDSIRIPLAADAAGHTYSFPLPDAPVVGLRVDPPGPDALIIGQLRLVNGHGEEVRRFTRADFRPTHEISDIAPATRGWKITPVPGASDPYSVLQLDHGLVPADMNARNLRRCLLSTGYLALLLWLLLLALHFATAGPASRRDLPRGVGFLLVIALLFSAAANRGLIRDSLHYARFTPAATPPGMQLELDLLSSGHTASQLFYDTGNGIREPDSLRREYEPHEGLQTLRFPLPGKPLQALRFDPRENAGRVEIRGIRIIDAGGVTRVVLPLDSLQARQEIALCRPGADRLEVETTPGSTDPILEFTPAAVAAVNRTLARPSRP